mmetsp:Transcript_27946/g.90990  ORF Transcript_27946/g.90990 Transcript_27946/m.90990 type:complete len:296 (-) Transcript_27946:287-1174(-)
MTAARPTPPPPPRAARLSTFERGWVSCIGRRRSSRRRGLGSRWACRTRSRAMRRGTSSRRTTAAGSACATCPPSACSRRCLSLPLLEESLAGATAAAHAAVALWSTHPSALARRLAAAGAVRVRRRGAALPIPGQVTVQPGGGLVHQHARTEAAACARGPAGRRLGSAAARDARDAGAARGVELAAAPRLAREAAARAAASPRARGRPGSGGARGRGRSRGGRRRGGSCARRRGPTERCTGRRAQALSGLGPSSTAMGSSALPCATLLAARRKGGGGVAAAGPVARPQPRSRRPV